MHRGKHNLQFNFQGSFLTFYKYYSIIFIKSQIFYFAFSQNQDAPREGAKYYIPLCQNFTSSGVDLSYFLDKSMCTSVNINTKVSKVSKVIAYTNNRQGQIQTVVESVLNLLRGTSHSMVTRWRFELQLSSFSQPFITLLPPIIFYLVHNSQPILQLDY